MPEVRLKAAGKVFGGWTSMRLSLGMERCANGFEIEVTELWADRAEVRRIPPWAPCEVWLDDDLVITGYVDEVSVRHSSGTHTVSIRGRDRTADLVDCSAIHQAGQWRGLKIEQIAAVLAKPFKVAVRAEVDTGKPLASFALQDGETAFEAIERMARMRGVLVMSTPAGELLFTRAGQQRIGTALVLGENILEGSLRYDVRDCFSEYLVKGQAPTRFFDTAASAAQASADAAKAATQMKALATDPRVPRYRPMQLTAECADPAVPLAQRAQWEATVRAARSAGVEIVVQGWRHADGLWCANRLVLVRDAWLGVDAQMLISGVQFSLDESGSRATLKLTYAQAYTLLPTKEQGAAPGQWFDDRTKLDKLAASGGRR